MSIREKSCLNKKRFELRGDAERQKGATVYACKYCGGFHRSLQTQKSLSKNGNLTSKAILEKYKYYKSKKIHWAKRDIKIVIKKEFQNSEVKKILRKLYTTLNVLPDSTTGVVRINKTQFLTLRYFLDPRKVEFYGVKKDWVR